MWRPSGPTPTQFIPAPQVTATPQPVALGVLLVREVETSHEQDREIGGRPDLGGQRFEDVGARFDTDVVRVAERTARETEH